MVKSQSYDGKAAVAAMNLQQRAANLQRDTQPAVVRIPLKHLQDMRAAIAEACIYESGAKFTALRQQIRVINAAIINSGYGAVDDPKGAERGR